MALAQQIKTLPKTQSAEIFYHDKYSGEKESSFIIERSRWKNIKQNNSSNKTLTDKEIEYIALINGFLRSSSPQVEYFTKEYLGERLDIGERQLRRIRKNTSHIFITRWKKRIYTYRGILEDVYVIRPTDHTTTLLGEPKYYRSVKVGHQCPTSIYKDEKNIKKNRSSESNVLKNSFSSSKKQTEPPKTAKIKKLYQNQYDKPKTLTEEELVTEKEYPEIAKLSGRDFTLQAMNEVLQNMQKRYPNKRFHSRRQFIVWFSICMKYEMRDAVKTANPGFYIKGNKTQAEIVEHTTQQDRERYLNQIEDEEYKNPCSETKLKSKWANALAPNTAYNLLKNLRYWRIVGGVMEIYLQKGMDMLEMQKNTLLSQIQAVVAYEEVQEFKLIVENK